MKENLKEALLKVSIDSPESFADDVWQTVKKRQKYYTYTKLSLFSLVGITSFIIFIPAFKTLLSDFSQSGFYEYLSLAFSNSNSIITHWKDFMLLLGESLPVLSVISSLTLIFIFFLSVKYMMREIIKGQSLLSA